MYGLPCQQAPGRIFPFSSAAAADLTLCLLLAPDERAVQRLRDRLARDPCFALGVYLNGHPCPGGGSEADAGLAFPSPECLLADPRSFALVAEASDCLDESAVMEWADWCESTVAVLHLLSAVKESPSLPPCPLLLLAEESPLGSQVLQGDNLWGESSSSDVWQAEIDRARRQLHDHDQEDALAQAAKRIAAQARNQFLAKQPGAAEGARQLVKRLLELQDLKQSFASQLEREKLAAMKELAYGASHEINNPLANITTRAQMLLREEADPERRRKLAT